MLGKMILNNNSRLLLIIKSAIAKFKKFDVIEAELGKGEEEKIFLSYLRREGITSREKNTMWLIIVDEVS